MSLAPNPAPILPRCKIKRVNPAFRSVSTPRGTKDLPVVGPVNTTASPASLHGPESASEWSAERRSERLLIELAPAAWTRRIGSAKRRGVTLAHLLRSALSEVA
jgi:hypothetical protein